MTTPHLSQVGVMPPEGATVWPAVLGKLYGLPATVPNAGTDSCVAALSVCWHSLYCAVAPPAKMAAVD